MACAASNSQSRRPRRGIRAPVTAISRAKQGSAMANRSAVAVKGGSPVPMILLATTVLPTSIMAAARQQYPCILPFMSVYAAESERRSVGRRRGASLE